MYKDKWIQISQRPRLSILPNLFSCEAITSVMKDFAGYTFKGLIMSIERGMMHFFWGEKDMERVFKLSLNRALSSPDILARAIKIISYRARPLLKWAEELSKKDLKKVSNATLNGYYQKYYRDYKQIYGRYFTILTMETPVKDWLLARLDKKVNDKNKALEYFGVLTLHPEAMVALVEKRALLKLALLIKEKNVKAFEKNRNILKLIKEHQRKFFWISRDYEDPIMEVSDVINNLKKILKKGFIKEFKEIDKKFTGHPAEVKRLEKQLKLNVQEKRIFKLMRDGLYLKELRKTIVSKTLYYLDPLMTEIGRRANLTLQQVRNILPSEVSKALAGKDYSELLTDRYNLAVCLVAKGKSRVVVGKEARGWRKKIMPKVSGQKVMTGQISSYGRAMGRAKIVIDPKDLHKVKKGDIMITVQAVPSFSPAIQKAAALTADGGTGITSHPATLAREAGIPCITGARIATKVLKDGDMVEVDAYKGVIKKL